MTTPNQADRDAAADWCEAQPFPSKQAEAPAIRAGEYDHHSLVQAFAAHRRLGIEQGKRMAGGEVERLREALEEIADTTHKQQLPITAQVHDIARAALNGDRHD